MSTALVVPSPPTPRILMPPEPPLLMPKPKMLRCEMKRPGTCPEIAESSWVRPVAAIFELFTVLTV